MQVCLQHVHTAATHAILIRHNRSVRGCPAVHALLLANTCTKLQVVKALLSFEDDDTAKIILHDNMPKLGAVVK